MSAPRANKEDKKKRLGSRRSKAKQNEPYEADEGDFMASASVAEENTDSSRASNLGKSENESQHQPLAEHTEKRRKLGSSRINKGRQQVQDLETASSLRPRQVDEKPGGSEGLERAHVSWETQFEQQEDLSQAREHETHSSSLYSISMSHNAADHEEDVSKMLTSESESGNECKVSDLGRLTKAVLKADTPLTDRVKETDDFSQMVSLSFLTTDQQLVYQSNLKKMPKEEQYKVHSATEKETTERCGDADVVGNLYGTNLTSESHVRDLEVRAPAAIADKTEELLADEAQREGSSASLERAQVKDSVDSNETFEVADETLLIQTAVPVKTRETWTADTVKEAANLPELNISHVTPQVNQQPTGPPAVGQMPDEISSMFSVVKNERVDTDVLGQQAVLQAGSSESGSSFIPETNTGRCSYGEHIGPECSVAQEAALEEELSENEKQNEFKHTHTSESHMKRFDNTGTSEEGLNPDKTQESFTEERPFQPCQEQKEGLVYEDEKSKTSRRPEPEIHSSLTSQTRENLVSTDEQMSDFNRIESKRNLGSRCRNKDSVAESYHDDEEDHIEHNGTNEGLETLTLHVQAIKQEETTQETVHDIIMSVTDDSSIYSVLMPGVVKASEANNENEADFKVEALSESLEDLSEGVDTFKGTEDCASTLNISKPDNYYEPPAKENECESVDQENVDYHVYETREMQPTDSEEPSDAGLFQLTEDQIEDKENTGPEGKHELWSLGVHTEPGCSTGIEELSKSQEQSEHLNLSEARGAQPSDEAHVHEQDGAENAEFMDTYQHKTDASDQISDYHVDNTKKPQVTDTELSEESLESQGHVEEAVPTSHQEGAFSEVKESVCGSETHLQTQDNSFSIDEPESTDFRLSKRKVGSRRKNKGQQQVTDSDAETAEKSETEIQETSLGSTDTPQTSDGGEDVDAHTGTSHLTRTNNTDAQQVMDQSNVTKVHVDEIPHQSSVTDTESNEKDKNTDLLRRWETLQTNGHEKSTEQSSLGEETEPEGRAERAARSSPKKEQKESFTLSDVCTAKVQEMNYISAEENSPSGAHTPVDTSPNKEETHKSAEHRRKLGSSRRVKGKQHALDSASEKDDVGNMGGDEEASLTHKEFKPQTDPGVNSSEQIRNEGETTRKEDTAPAHHVTETTDVTSASDAGEGLTHTEQSENPTANEQIQGSEAVETSRLSAASQRTGKEETVDDIITSATHDTSLCPASRPRHSTEEHEEIEMSVESVGHTLEDTDKADSSPEGNITEVLDQRNQDRRLLEDVNPDTSDATSAPSGRSPVNKNKSQKEDDINAPEQPGCAAMEGPALGEERTQPLQTLQSEIHVSLEPQTQDNAGSIEEPNNKGFKSMGRRKLGSSRRSQGKHHGTNPESDQAPTEEATQTVCCEQSETSLGAGQDTPHTEHVHEPAENQALVATSELAHISVGSSSTLDRQLNEQSNAEMRPHGSVSGPESREGDKDTRQGHESSVTEKKETEPDWPLEQAALSSSRKETSANEEQSHGFHVCQVTVAQHVEAAATNEHQDEREITEVQEMNPLHYNSSSGQSPSGAHAPNKEETHKSAEHRRKLGSSRRVKGTQHALDSASEKDDEGNMGADEEASLTHKEFTQQTDPGVSSSEQIRNEGETTRKEDTAPAHHVTETTDVTSASDAGEGLGKHTEESENLSLLTGKPDNLLQPSLSQLLPPKTDDAVNLETSQKDQQGPETVKVAQGRALKAADVPGLAGTGLQKQESTVRGAAEGENVREPSEDGGNNTVCDVRKESPSLNLTNRRKKMGSTRRDLGSPSRREEADNDTPEAAGDAGGGSSGNIEPIHVTASQSAERNPASLGRLEDTEPQENPGGLGTKPSTSPKRDVTSEPSLGGRRRKFGSNRKSRGNNEDQTAGEDRIIDAPKEPEGPSEERGIRTSDGEDGGQAVVLINESESKKLSPDISSAAESWRPGSEKVAPHVGMNLGQETHHNLSLADDSTDVRSTGYNVLMVGDTNVGKTSFMKRAQSGKFSLDLPSSVGLDSCTWTVVVDGQRVVLHLWDTAGQERFHSITRQIFHKAQAFLLMYDITSSKSFSAVSYWANCIQEGSAENVSILLLGNKSDRAERRVQTQDGEVLAKEYNFEFMECSAATGDNVIECLEAIARTLTQRADTRQEAVALKQEPRPKKQSGCC